MIKHFNTKSLKGFGISGMHDAIVAGGSILHYLGQNKHNQL